jgi:hypothetical protein
MYGQVVTFPYCGFLLSGIFPAKMFTGFFAYIDPQPEKGRI